MTIQDPGSHLLLQRAIIRHLFWRINHYNLRKKIVKEFFPQKQPGNDQKRKTLLPNWVDKKRVIRHSE